MTLTQRSCFAIGFGLIFQIISAVIAFNGFMGFFDEVLYKDTEFTTAIIASINTLIIALAMFELGFGISKEYLAEEHGDTACFYATIRRTITRFVATVCIALVLEALIMIIKYSQLDLAGNLWYPVGILVGSSFLLIALGLFLFLTQGEKAKESVLVQTDVPDRSARETIESGRAVLTGSV